MCQRTQRLWLCTCNPALVSLHWTWVNNCLNSTKLNIFRYLQLFISKAMTSKTCFPNPSISPTGAESVEGQVLLDQHISDMFYTIYIVEGWTGEMKDHLSSKMGDCLMIFISKAMTSKTCLSNPSISPPPYGGRKHWKTSINMPTSIQYTVYNFYDRGMSKRDEKPSKLQNGRLFDGVYTDS